MNQLYNTNQFYEAEYKTSKIVPQVSSAKNVKSLSPRIKLSANSPYRTGKLGSRIFQQIGPVNNFFANLSQQNGVVISRTPSKIFSSAGDSKLKAVNNLPI